MVVSLHWDQGFFPIPRGACLCRSSVGPIPPSQCGSQLAGTAPVEAGGLLGSCCCQAAVGGVWVQPMSVSADSSPREL